MSNSQRKCKDGTLKSQLAAGQVSSNGGREKGGTRWEPRETRKGRTYELLVTASSMDGFGLKVGDLLERMILFRKGTRGEPWEGEVNTRGTREREKSTFIGLLNNI